MGLRTLIPILAGGVVAAQGIYYATKDINELLRPPGAAGEADFLAKCIRCGRCIEACPYVCLRAANDLEGAAVGTPFLDVRKKACQLCEDFPCVEACPTGALSAPSDDAPMKREDVDMGLAVIKEDLCIAVISGRCEICYNVCPLKGTAISIDPRLREGDTIHPIFAPIIDEEDCVGCGLCVEHCPVGLEAQSGKPKDFPGADNTELAIKVLRDRKQAVAETTLR